MKQPYNLAAWSGTGAKRGLALLPALLLAGLGCQDVDPAQGYTSRQLYRTDVRTVYVEMFQSQDFRRGVEFEVTRALCEQLELHTPYRLAGDRRSADTVLYGTVNRVGESVVASQRELDRPLAKEVVLNVTFSWKDLRSGEYLLQDRRVRVSGDYAALLGAGRESAALEAANELAVRIVEAMEAPW